MPLCMAARGTSMRARRCACAHEAHAPVHADVDACTRHMHACSSMCMAARGTCTRVRRSACVHKAHACVLIDVHGCTRHMHTCSPICMRARGTSGMLADVRACRAACWLARMMFGLAARTACRHPKVAECLLS